MRDATNVSRAIPGALVEFFRYPASLGPTEPWLEADEPPAEHVTETLAQLFRGEDNFGFDPETGSCINGVGDDVLRTEQFYRVEVSKAGYERGIFYRFHPGYTEDCSVFRCPTSSKTGPSIPGGVEKRKDYCHSEHFLVWPESDDGHEGFPDLVSDPRALQEHYFQCVYTSGGAPPAPPDFIGLRASLGAANVGDSDLWLEQLRPGGNCGTGSNPNPCPDGFHCEDARCVPDTCNPTTGSGCPPELECNALGECANPMCSFHFECRSGICGSDGQCVAPAIQKTFNSSTGELVSRIVLAGNFAFHEQHRHFHFDDFAELNLVETDTSCESFESRNDDDCVVRSGDKISFCIVDSQLFDQEVAVIKDPTMKFFRGCNSHTQGISRGWEDVYAHHLAGQVIVLGTPVQFLGELGGRNLWLEAIVDPNDVLEERRTRGVDRDLAQPLQLRQRQERANNRARVEVQFPSLGQIADFEKELCEPSAADISDARAVLDCSDCREEDVEGVAHPCGNLWVPDRRTATMCSDYL